MARKVSYLDNLQKELGQLKKAAKASTGTRGTYSKSGEKNYKSALGQAVGAALQGRRYDSKGKQINK